MPPTMRTRRAVASGPEIDHRSDLPNADMQSRRDELERGIERRVVGSELDLLIGIHATIEQYCNLLRLAEVS